jgi:hypothetical protein
VLPYGVAKGSGLCDTGWMVSASALGRAEESDGVKYVFSFSEAMFELLEGFMMALTRRWEP